MPEQPKQLDQWENIDITRDAAFGLQAMYESSAWADHCRALQTRLMDNPMATFNDLNSTTNKLLQAQGEHVTLLWQIEMPNTLKDFISYLKYLDKTEEARKKQNTS